MSDKNDCLPVVVIGAGPVGMAAAAHLIQNGKVPLILEAGPSVAANLESYRQVSLFSRWRHNIDSAALDLLAAAGWEHPDLEILPTAGDVIDEYLTPLSNLPAFASQIKLQHRVVHVTRQGYDKAKTKGRMGAPFLVRAVTPGGIVEFRAKAVIDASGTWSQPSPLGANGIPAIGEVECAANITYGMPDVIGADRQRFGGKRVLVVGAGHSAVGNLLALARVAEEIPGTTVLWAIRGNDEAKIFGNSCAKEVSVRGHLGLRLKSLYDAGKVALHKNFRVQELMNRPEGIDIVGEPVGGEIPRILDVQEIIGATGARPDVEMTRELRTRHDHCLESSESLAPLIDPNTHSCGTVRPLTYRDLLHPEHRYFSVGAKSYGRAPNFLMATGYEQVHSVVMALIEDINIGDEDNIRLEQFRCLHGPIRFRSI